MRTCIGCRRTDEPDEMIRLVLVEDGRLAVDLQGRAPGRGGWVHPRPECVGDAARGGAAKGFRARVTTSPTELAGAVRSAADRRVRALLASARGAGRLACGSDAAEAASRSGEAALILVAVDARAAAHAGWLLADGASGKVLHWGTKEDVGRATARAETAVVAVLDGGFARAIARAVALSALPDPGARRDGAGAAHMEVR